MVLKTFVQLTFYNTWDFIILLLNFDEFFCVVWFDQFDWCYFLLNCNDWLSWDFVCLSSKIVRYWTDGVLVNFIKMEFTENWVFECYWPWGSGHFLYQPRIAKLITYKNTTFYTFKLVISKTFYFTFIKVICIKGNEVFLTFTKDGFILSI